MKRPRKDYRQVTLLLTREQFIALDGKAYANGVGLTIQARHIIADALDVPRTTISDSVTKDLLDAT
jgi:hypothetical protein